MSSPSERTSGTSPVNKMPEHAYIEGATLFNGTASEVGSSFFGRIFSGHKAQRLDLGGKTDSTHRLGVKILGVKPNNIQENSEEKNWGYNDGCVPLYIKTKGEDGKDKVTVVAAQISSLSARLGMKKEDILLAAGTGHLEERISEKIQEYQSDKKTVDNFKTTVNQILNKNKLSTEKVREIRESIKGLDLKTKDSFLPLYLLKRNSKSEDDLDQLNKNLSKFYEELYRLMKF